MRRLAVLLGSSALLLSGSSNALPVFATTGRVAPVLEDTLDLSLRNVETPEVDQEQPLKPIAPPQPLAVRSVSTGQASWYGPGFYGNRTANGERFRPGTLTAAHRTLPFGTKVRVTNLRNGRTAVVRINDRGPFHGNRVIDLAHGAANQLGVIASGVAKVKLEVLR
ncbi:MAG: septal ring lytic transglycosylase RlpA family protein [Vulcanococcus sp.]|jgi:rare lipoprotein A